MTPTLTPKLQTIADKVRALETMKDRSGFQTKKSIRELLSPLTAEELASVAMEVYVSDWVYRARCCLKGKL